MGMTKKQKRKKKAKPNRVRVIDKNTSTSNFQEARKDLVDFFFRKY